MSLIISILWPSIQMQHGKARLSWRYSDKTSLSSFSGKTTEENVKRAGAVAERSWPLGRRSWVAILLLLEPAFKPWRRWSRWTDVTAPSPCFPLWREALWVTETWLWPLSKETVTENSSKTGSPELWLTATVWPGPWYSTTCLIKVKPPCLIVQDQMAVMHCTDQEAIICNEKFWSRHRAQTMLTDSSTG